MADIKFNNDFEWVVENGDFAVTSTDIEQDTQDSQLLISLDKGHIIDNFFKGIGIKKFTNRIINFVLINDIFRYLNDEGINPTFIDFDNKGNINIKFD